VDKCSEGFQIFFREIQDEPQAIVAARNPAISVSSFFEKRCGMDMGSDAINRAEL